MCRDNSEGNTKPPHPPMAVVPLVRGMLPYTELPLSNHYLRKYFLKKHWRSFNK